MRFRRIAGAPGGYPPRPFRIPLLIAPLLLLPAACTFEQRPDRPPEDEPAREDTLEAEVPALSPARSARDSVRVVSDTFREAMEVGDLSSALAFLHPDAVVMDRLGGDPPEGATTGEVLLRAIRLRQEGLRLATRGASITVMGSTALVLVRSDATWEGESAGPTVRGPVYETVLFVRTDEGWRLRHLHRSEAPGSAG